MAQQPLQQLAQRLVTWLWQEPPRPAAPRTSRSSRTRRKAPLPSCSPRRPNLPDANLPRSSQPTLHRRVPLAYQKQGPVLSTRVSFSPFCSRCPPKVALSLHRRAFKQRRFLRILFPKRCPRLHSRIRTQVVTARCVRCRTHPTRTVRTVPQTFSSTSSRG